MSTRVFRRPAAGLRLACCPWGGGGTGTIVKVNVREKDGAVAGPMDLIFARRHPRAVHNRHAIAPQERLANGASVKIYLKTIGYE